MLQRIKKVEHVYKFIGIVHTYRDYLAEEVKRVILQHIYVPTCQQLEIYHSLTFLPKNTLPLSIAMAYTTHSKYTIVIYYVLSNPPTSTLNP